MFFPEYIAPESLQITATYHKSLLFLSLGLVSLKKNYFELAVIFFGICIGTRIYFFLFIFFSIYYYQYKPDLNFIRKSFIFLASFFVGGLFLWLLLQDTYGEDNFQTTSKCLDILRYKEKSILDVKCITGF